MSCILLSCLNRSLFLLLCVADPRRCCAGSLGGTSIHRSSERHSNLVQKYFEQEIIERMYGACHVLFFMGTSGLLSSKI